MRDEPNIGLRCLSARSSNTMKGFGSTAGRWLWMSKSAKAWVTTHRPHGLPPKIKFAYAGDWLICSYIFSLKSYVVLYILCETLHFPVYSYWNAMHSYIFPLRSHVFLYIPFGSLTFSYIFLLRSYVFLYNPIEVLHFPIYSNWNNTFPGDEGWT